MSLAIASPQIKTTIVAAGTATDTVIKGTPGVFYGMIVTATGTNPANVFDNATTHTGTIVGSAAASAAVQFYNAPIGGVPCLAGITLQGNAANPALTILWS